MKELLTSNRISLATDYHYWRQYYLAPIFLGLGGTVGLVIGLSKGEDLSDLFWFFVFAVLGWLLLYWLNRQLYFKERSLSTSVEEFREELYRVLEKEGWEFNHKTLKFCIAKKKNELLAVKFSKTTYKWCLTGDFMGFGPLFSIIPYYPKGMKVFKSLNAKIEELEKK